MNVQAEPIEQLGRQLWGDPTQKTAHEWRFGSHGSKSIKVKDQTWFDHEANEGGGYGDLFFRVHGRRPQASPSSISATYDYHDATGKLVFQVARLIPKTFRQRRPDGNGGWIWDMRGVDRVPYRLPDLLRAAPDALVFICEGEKDCDNLRERGLIATTNPGGAGKWSPAYNPHLRGRHVVVLSDNDPQATMPDGTLRFHPDGRPVLPGQAHAADVARSLQGTAASVRVLMLPGLPLKGDVSDWLAAGGTAEELEALAAAAPQQEQQPTSEPPPALWIDDEPWIEAELPRRPWVAPGFALRGAVTLLCGPPSALKSSLALAWACSLALGQDFGRFRPVQAAPVIVYNVEDDQTEQRRRLSATLRQFGATPADIAGKVIRTGPSSIGTLLARDEDGNLQFTPAMQRLEQMIAARKPALLIVDPLAELHSEEENDNTAIRAVIARFRALAVAHNIAVVVLHHTRKGGAASPGDPDIARGASAIIGAVRVALTLTGMSEDDAQAFGLPTDAKARSNFVRLDDAKQNYAPIRDAQWFEKLVHELDNGELVPAATPWTPPEAKEATQADLAALATAIERGAPGGEPYSPRLSNDVRSVKRLLEQYGFTGSDAQKNAMQRLQGECHVSGAQYRRPMNRVKAVGLRVGDLPVADWTDVSVAGEG